jgi:uncharacterized protein (TIGR02246 family)
MSDARHVFDALLRSYAEANNTSDTPAYTALFTADAIWMPPGTEPVFGPDQIGKKVQSYFDEATWHARFTPVDAQQLADGWIYGIAAVDVTTRAHSNGAEASFRLTAAWLLQLQGAGHWLIARQIWNQESA